MTLKHTLYTELTADQSVDLAVNRMFSGDVLQTRFTEGTPNHVAIMLVDRDTHKATPHVVVIHRWADVPVVARQLVGDTNQVVGCIATYAHDTPVDEVPEEFTGSFPFFDEEERFFGIQRHHAGRAILRKQGMGITPIQETQIEAGRDTWVRDVKYIVDDLVDVVTNSTAEGAPTPAEAVVETAERICGLIEGTTTSPGYHLIPRVEGVAMMPVTVDKWREANTASPLTDSFDITLSVRGLFDDINS